MSTLKAPWMKAAFSLLSFGIGARVGSRQLVASLVGFFDDLTWCFFINLQ